MSVRYLEGQLYCPWPRTPDPKRSKSKRRGREVMVAASLPMEVMDYTMRNEDCPERAKNIYLGAMITMINDTIAESNADSD